MSRHVILGAGPVAHAIVASLTQRGIEVDVVSRSGTKIDGARTVTANVLDTENLKSVISGCDAVYQASQPGYHRWPQEFPTMQDSVVRAVRGSNAVLVSVENLYGYGPVAKPLTESLPLIATTRKGKTRADMWRSLEAEHKAGRLKVTAGRASDFFGLHVEGSCVGDRFFKSLLRGKKAEMFGNPDALHSYTYVTDFGEALVRLALDERSLGRAWHVPNAPTVSTRKFLKLAASIAGVEAKHVTRSRLQLRLAGVFIPPARESIEMLYEFEEDFVVDHSAYAAVFGDHATPLNDSLAATIDWWRSNPAI
ncbi:MAG: NAD-dependent epimerase/dehydratase family protein [Actinobacteria bacterium]|nr:NAD-dependent epimerase/dehydratase family protein [Actinomycetota bacterium]NDC91490.1 NAD-dependent epimerase/dehydratase family protein [Acidimicrobiia bacterium]HBQ52155.1 epimerase [Acidimicrobium sp.]NCU86841.1 NAD-dependent epimerase/dehydratase family protein [Actinomycetota bacterium]NDD72756.1 NAD-dependent epimerase/dehydratase family protein [Actinomycetota bacterium]